MRDRWPSLRHIQWSDHASLRWMARGHGEPRPDDAQMARYVGRIGPWYGFEIDPLVLVCRVGWDHWTVVTCWPRVWWEAKWAASQRCQQGGA